MLETPRLRLVPASPELARAEINDRDRFAALLGAAVPANWPPETLADALEFFLGLLEQNPGWPGWLGWYAVERGTDGDVLVANGGFKGPPDEQGQVEIGYSVLPQFQGRGIASELMAALVAWAGRQPGVRTVLAQTTPDNLGSQGVLARLGLVAVGPGPDEGHTLYRKDLA